MVSLDQKIKLPNTCEKRLDYHITVLLYKKRFEKTANIKKNATILKIGENSHYAKVVAFA